MSHHVAILGAGKIGRMTAHLLASCGDYTVRIGDAHEPSALAVARDERIDGRRVDFNSPTELAAFLKGAWAVVSCAPFNCNVGIAQAAKDAGCHYLDLTEDVAVTKKVMQLSQGASTAFIPQCGLAPGFITIVAHSLLRELDTVDTVRMRVGALPRTPSNVLQYNLTWSTDGLVNEYCNPCEALVDGQMCLVPPLEQVERLHIDGCEYEAFNTSGGLGTLADSLRGTVRNLNYKTIRFTGHAEQMRFLLNDLRFIEHRDELKAVLERAVPGTDDDQVVIFVSATGQRGGRFMDRTWARTVLSREIGGRHWTAIQVTTAAGICAVVDMLKEGTVPVKGFVRQEQITLDAFLANRFGRHYA
ncbi:MAG: saccharopine dehydrogenase family protein [Phycisphaerales bacterium]|jgi:saccharopine dehydrogenase-like NADP-dependent oxidoreductase